MVFRDYSPGFLMTNYIPERDTENIAANVKTCYDLGVSAVFREGRKAWMATWLSYYVMARVTWDSEEELEDIKRDFYPTFFGPAGQPVRNWWDACSIELAKTAYQAHEDWLVNHIYTRAFLSSIRPNIEKAVKAATQEPYKSRVHAVKLIADHLDGYAEMWAGQRSQDFRAALQGAEKMEKMKEQLHAIYPHFTNPGQKANMAYMCAGNNVRLQALIDRTEGKTGKRMADIPELVEFKKDPFNDGVLGEWYKPERDDGDWEHVSCFHLLEQQERFLDEEGHDFNGLCWYRMDVDIPENVQKEDLRLWLGGALNEAWIWVNGEFAGHRKFNIWWSSRNRHVDVDITGKVRPGRNIITVRVDNSAEVGGLFHRGFVYQPVLQASAEAQGRK